MIKVLSSPCTSIVIRGGVRQEKKGDGRERKKSGVGGPPGLAIRGCSLVCCYRNDGVSKLEISLEWEGNDQRGK